MNTHQLTNKVIDLIASYIAECKITNKRISKHGCAAYVLDETHMSLEDLERNYYDLISDAIDGRSNEDTN